MSESVTDRTENICLSIVPTPVRQSVSADNDGKPIYREFESVLHITAPEFEKPALAASEYMRRAGFGVTVSKDDCRSGRNGIVGNAGRIIAVKDGTLGSGGYLISTGMGTDNDGSGNAACVIKAADTKGISYAFATLLQIMRGGGDCSCADTVLLPVCEIEDRPDCSYRGMMVDLARSWHEPEYLFRYADMCWYYKVSVLHLHFTDDQSYTLPSRILPKIPTEGRHYTFETIEKLDEYAFERGVSILPEIDVPGHCTAFQTEYPEIFGTDGIICQNEEAIGIMADMFGELCDMFPHSDKIHIGGDEANISQWLKCERCREYAKDAGIDPDAEHAEDLIYVNFVCKMADAVRRRGRTPVVWEGFPKSVNHLVPKDITVMSWENFYQVTPDLLEAGFTVINCSWNPMYVVTPEPAWPVREIYDWSVYKWMPVHGGSPFLGVGYRAEPTEQISGGQLLAWGDRIPGGYSTHKEGVDAELALLTERLPYLAENTWNRERRIPFETIEDHIKYTDALLGRISPKCP